MSSNSEFKAASSLANALILWTTISFFGTALMVFWFFDYRFGVFLEDQVNHDLEAVLRSLNREPRDTFDLTDLQTEMDTYSQTKGVANVFFKLFLKNDRPTLQTDMSAWKDLSLPAPTPSIATKRLFLHHPAIAHAGVKILEAPYGNDGTWQLGMSLSQIRQLQIHRRWATAGWLFLFAAVGATVMALIIHRKLKTVGSVFQEASQIIQFGEFHNKIPQPKKEGASRWLANTFNGVFSNINDLMKEMDQVLGDVAHDLRTPIARLRGQAESLLSEPDTTEREIALCGRTIEECDHILALVNTILEINAAEARTTSLRNQDVDMVALIEEAIDLFGSLIEDKAHVVTRDLPARSVIFGDRRYLQRILANLLDNAIKYTPKEGKIHLSLQSEHGRVIIQVIDNGIGIAAEESALIFNRFYRCDKSRTMPGHGLGLTFCKAIVEAMNGRLTYKPNVEGGSIFELMLPAGIRERPF